MAYLGEDVWTVIPHEGIVVVRLKHAPPLVEWELLLDETHRYAMHASAVVLEGSGWLDPFAQAMETVLRRTLEHFGVTVTTPRAGVL